MRKVVLEHRISHESHIIRIPSLDCLTISDSVNVCSVENAMLCQRNEFRIDGGVGSCSGDAFCFEFCGREFGGGFRLVDECAEWTTVSEHDVGFFVCDVKV